MRVHIQRVLSAKVEINGKVAGEIGPGLLLLIGFCQQDSHQIFSRMADKIWQLRIFTNNEGRFDRSALEIEGSLLAVPQFTLYADCSKGRRPDFFEAMAPDKAKDYFDLFVHALKEKCPQVECGVFGAHMQVSLVNDGPVTILLDSDELFGPARC